MGRFYLRVLKDGIRERTWGCGSRGENNQNYKDYLQNLLSLVNQYKDNSDILSNINFGKIYRLELVKNRHGEKEIYREIEIELCVPKSDNDNAGYIVLKDVTYITEGFDPRILVLPPDW